MGVLVIYPLSLELILRERPLPLNEKMAVRLVIALNKVYALVDLLLLQHRFLTNKSKRLHSACFILVVLSLFKLEMIRKG